jgi:hypothetical protein
MTSRTLAACGVVIVVAVAFMLFLIPAAELPQSGNTEILSLVAVGESTKGLLVDITPLEVLEDSRCPLDVECIQAGTVRVLAQVGSDTLTYTLTEGKPLVVQNSIVTLQAVSPSPRAGVAIPIGEYRFSFKTEVAGDGTGTLTGSIGIGPLCPTEKEAEPCDVPPEVYAELKVHVYRVDKRTLVKTLTPNEKGRYRTDLPAGTYWVTTDERPEIGKIEGAPQEIRIRPLQTSIISIIIDTGIR